MIAVIVDPHPDNQYMTQMESSADDVSDSWVDTNNQTPDTAYTASRHSTIWLMILIRLLQ
jgi:hypothetical protein